MSSLTACAGGGDGGADLAAATPSQEPTAGPARVWEPIWDPSERVSVGLPSGAQVFESTTALADGSEAAVMLLRAVPLGGHQEVVAVYVGGPGAERERLEAEFARLITSMVVA